jgi:hypothetical protein
MATREAFDERQQRGNDVLAPAAIEAAGDDKRDAHGIIIMSGMELSQRTGPW